jgi:asparagine synthase (glutamine-hydrolysing)
MCGIAGIVGNISEPKGKEVVSAMLKTIYHRGPDSSGFWATNGLAFGMRRLSIIDLEGGDQPIWSDDGVGIVFNGEIYNYKILRKQLESEGVNFRTHSDTEVILQLYCQKGLDAIRNLEGMFAIFLYDPRIQKVYLIRDRLGVKPLYYYHAQGDFFFASEIKAILVGLSERPNLNYQAIWDYLTLRYVPAPETIWSGILKLEPAHLLEFDLQDGQIQIKRYWNFEFLSEDFSDRDYEKEFEALFLQAVQKRLLASDVPVGILLSGGLDSSVVAAAAIEMGHKNFHTFSIGFADGGKYSELAYARQVADHVGSEHHQVVIDQHDFLQFIPELVYFSDEPLADLASIPLYYVSRLARQHVKVVLSGEGSDEILAGYDLDRLECRLSYLKFLSHLPGFLLRLVPHEKISLLGSHGYSNYLKVQASHMTRIFTEEEKKSLCKFPATQSTVERIQGWYDLTRSPEPLDQVQQVYCHSWLVEDLLMKADKMTMATSLELRVPFLDHKLMEWATRLPKEWKVGNCKVGFSSKRILRCFAKKRLPINIIKRPKQGFPVPAYDWLKNSLRPWMHEKLSDPGLTHYFDASSLQKIASQVENGSLHKAHQAWNLIVMGEWLKRWA